MEEAMRETREILAGTIQAKTYGSAQELFNEPGDK